MNIWPVEILRKAKKIGIVAGKASRSWPRGWRRGLFPYGNHVTRVLYPEPDKSHGGECGAPPHTKYNMKLLLSSSKPGNPLETKGLIFMTILSPTGCEAALLIIVPRARHSTRAGPSRGRPEGATKDTDQAA